MLQPMQDPHWSRYTLEELQPVESPGWSRGLAGAVSYNPSWSRSKCEEERRGTEEMLGTDHKPIPMPRAVLGGRRGGERSEVEPRKKEGYGNILSIITCHNLASNTPSPFSLWGGCFILAWTCSQFLVFVMENTQQVASVLKAFCNVPQVLAERSTQLSC